LKPAIFKPSADLRSAIHAALALMLAICVSAAIAGAQSTENSYVASLRRLTEQEYRHSIADIFGEQIEVRGVFEPTIREGGLAAASTATLSVTPAGFESFNKMADDIASQVAAEPYRAKLPCSPQNAEGPDDACAGEILSRYGRMLFRRPLTAAELKGRVALARSMALRTNDFYEGLHYSLAMLLQLPDFVFRKETAVPATGGAGYTLDSYSRATRLSFLMWNTTPDDELLRAAESGELMTDAGLARQVERLMASPRLDQGMRAFFDDMLQLDKFDTVSKDSLLYPKWGSAMADSAREETLRTVIGLTLHDNADIRDLMTTRETYLDRLLSVIYRVPFPFSGDWVKHEFPADSGRSGILTQVSMLSMFSHPGRSSPTIRGVALMEILLCQHMPPPPPDVDFSELNNTDGPLKTVRERLIAHAENPACAPCHMQTDPLGLPLEHFDAIGSFRTHDNGEPIDASAELMGKDISGAQGLGQYLHDNPRYPACVARKLYSYSRGLDSSKVKTDDFGEAYQAFEDSEFRLRALLKNMAASESFFAAPAPASASTEVAKN
jgi:hypothetical protein